MSSSKELKDLHRPALNTEDAKHIKESYKFFKGGALQILFTSVQNTLHFFFIELITIYNYVLMLVIICLISFFPYAVTSMRTTVVCCLLLFAQCPAECLMHGRYAINSHRIDGSHLASMSKGCIKDLFGAINILEFNVSIYGSHF